MAASTKNPLGFDPFTGSQPVVKKKAASKPKAAEPGTTATSPTKKPPKTPQKLSDKVAIGLQTKAGQPVKDLPDVATMRAGLDEIHRQLDALQKTVQTIPVPDNETAKSRPELLFLIESLKRFFDPKRALDFWFEFVLASRSADIDPFGLDPAFEQRVERFFGFLYSKWWRVTTTGIENISDEGRMLLVANHSGVIPYDGAMIKMAVRLEHPVARRVRFLVENFVFYFPFLGTFMYRFGSVRASQDNARRLLLKDELVAVFPEGVKGIGKLFKDRYQLQRFGRGGFVFLASQTQSPIVPVSVIGAEEIHPVVRTSPMLAKMMRTPYFPITPTFPALGPLGMIPYPTKWRIRFGEPYNPGQVPAEGEELWVHDCSLKVRRRIQELIYLELQERKSIFFG